MKLMNRTFLSACILTFTLSACGGGSSPPAESLANIPDTPSGASTGTGASQGSEQQVELDTVLESIRAKHNLPALAGIFVVGEQINQSSVIGEQVFGDGSLVLPDSKWHVGSLTKSMTATLAGRLVEAGMIAWDTRVSDVFPVLSSQGYKQYQQATLKSLLSHTAGMPTDMSKVQGWDSYFARTEKIQQVRREMVADILNMPPSTPGRFAYSNAGFVVAGAMLEAVTLEDWESLMQNQVFIPLDIHDAGFGSPESDIHPSGHSWENGQWRAYDSNELYADNPKAIGPAGTVHMSLASLVKYARAHMVGEYGGSDLLSPDTFRILHQEIAGSGYALGWFLQNDALFHDGSNTRWFAKLGINIERQIVAISVTNAGGQGANEATDEVINIMLERYLDQ